MTERTRWSDEEAWDWYREQEWPVGCNYLPSNAVNPTEMWNEERFSPDLIDKELGWAEEWGMNSLRVFFQYIQWEDDAEGLKRRFERFLDIAEDHGMTVMPVFFDDVAFSGEEPYLGPQKEPIQGSHNSQWTPSPGHERVVDRSVWPKLAEYVRDIVGSFNEDDRIIAWDTYNEPGNSKMDEVSNPLLKESFTWAREANPAQPITAGVNWDPNRHEQNRIGSEEADVVSFHDYSEFGFTRSRVSNLEEYGRPLLCTEWMARSRDNLPEIHLPYYKQKRIGCYTWGFVNGKLQTHLPWSTAQTSIAEAAIEDETTDVWFHDLVHEDGTPYRQEEYETFRRYVVDDEDAPSVAELVAAAPGESGVDGTPGETGKRQNDTGRHGYDHGR